VRQRKHEQLGLSELVTERARQLIEIFLGLSHEAKSISRARG
jgi:hypothetical protein